MPGRKYSAESGYRYGFNGKENDNEMKGDGNQQDYGMRIYDPRIGRFLSIDPLTSKYSDLSPYNFAANSPIWLIDKKGEEPDRNQAGTINQATTQWAQLRNQTVDGILNYIQTDPNAVRYVYTEKKGWIDLQHYFGTLSYGKAAMDAAEPASGWPILRTYVFGEGANESYFSYEDLPSNKFASEAKNLKETVKEPQTIGDGVVIEVDVEVYKTGNDLITSVSENFTEAKATLPESAPNWKQIPFRDHGERMRIPEIKGYKKSWISVGAPGAGMAIETSTPVYYTEEEKKEFLKSGKYIPQNHTSKPYDLKNFPAAPSSIQKGSNVVGATGH